MYIYNYFRFFVVMIRATGAGHTHQTLFIIFWKLVKFTHPLIDIVSGNCGTGFEYGTAASVTEGNRVRGRDLPEESLTQASRRLRSEARVPAPEASS